MDYLEAIKLADNTKGLLLDIGFGKGKNLTEFISYMNERKVLKRDIILYDSFEGYSEPTELDGDVFIKGGFKRPIQPAMDIRNTIKKDVKLVKGFIEDTLVGSFNKQSKIAIVHLDLVSNSSTLFSLSKLHSALSIDGVIIISGYGLYPGVKLAVDSFLKDNKKEYRIEYTGEKAVLSKVQYLNLNKRVTKDRSKISW